MKLLRRAIALADQWHVKLDGALAHLELARLLPEGSPDRIEHAATARDRFTTLGARYYLPDAERLISARGPT